MMLDTVPGVRYKGVMTTQQLTLDFTGPSMDRIPAPPPQVERLPQNPYATAITVPEVHARLGMYASDEACAWANARIGEICEARGTPQGRQMASKAYRHAAAYFCRCGKGTNAYPMNAAADELGI